MHIYGSPSAIICSRFASSERTTQILGTPNQTRQARVSAAYKVAHPQNGLGGFRANRHDAHGTDRLPLQRFSRIEVVPDNIQIFGAADFRQNDSRNACSNCGSEIVQKFAT